MMAEKPNVILVENDPFTLSLYQRELSPHYSIFTCESQAQATAALQEEKIDLVILEPANGNNWAWDFMDQLEQDKSTRMIPVIFCTVLDERKKGMEKGADAYLLKPVYANVLHHHVQELIAKQEVRKAKEKRLYMSFMTDRKG